MFQVVYSYLGCELFSWHTFASAQTGPRLYTWTAAVLCWGAGIAQWLEHRTRDWKIAGSNPCWNGGRIFFSMVDFLCWLLFRYPFHPRVTTVARKKSRSFCQKCRWQVTAKHAYTLCMWILLNRASALVTACPWYVKWHLRTLSINSSSSSSAGPSTCTRR